MGMPIMANNSNQAKAPMPNLSTPEFLTDRQRWDALIHRNSQAEGTFLYAVKTAGIYCRPTCASRLPNRANVRFFTTCPDAEQADFRACKRCQPNTISSRQQQSDTIANIYKLIETSNRSLSLSALAKAAGLSQYHFHRLFKTAVGITPKQYAAIDRAKRMRIELEQGTSVTQAIYNSGFGTSSNFYQGASGMLGMTPTDYKQGASGIRIRFAVQESILGWMLVAATDRGICTIEFGKTPEALIHQLQTRFSHAQFCAGDASFTSWVEQVANVVKTPERGLDLPLDIQGTAFQQRVWQILQTIPVGSTASYTEVAQRLGQPKAVRAVANACAANQLAVAIPCHRVIGSKGAITSYRWGVDRKRKLLSHEAAFMLQSSGANHY